MTYQPGPYPQPGYYTPPAPVKPHHGLAIAGFCVAIVGAIFGLIPITFFMAFILGALGIIFGAVGRKWAMGKWAIAIAIVAIALGIYGVIVVNRAVNDLNNDLNCISSSQTVDQMDQC